MKNHTIVLDGKLRLLPSDGGKVIKLKNKTILTD